MVKHAFNTFHFMQCTNVFKVFKVNAKNFLKTLYRLLSINHALIILGSTLQLQNYKTATHFIRYIQSEPKP